MNQILLKIYFIPILLIFVYLEALYQKTDLKMISSQLKLELNSSLWQIIAAKRRTLVKEPKFCPKKLAKKKTTFL